ncbi:MAG TPA: hypothetical protein VK181_20515 [Rhizobium sp.]|nr:hypothetical protein [Rhizobium sp.]
MSNRDSARQMEIETTRLLRGAMLVAIYQQFPKPSFQSMLNWLVKDFGLKQREFEQEIAYLRIRGWITTDEVRIIGRDDVRIELTAKGVDVARGIDPENPVLVD